MSNQSPIDPQDPESRLAAIRERQARAADQTAKLRMAAWRGMAGPHLERMLASEEQAQVYLSHGDPDVRSAALSVLAERFGAWESVESQCHKVIESDPEPRVRLHAKVCLSRCYHRRRDPRSKRVLAEMVKDVSVDEEVRSQCYVLLMEVSNMHIAGWGGRFPDDVDWALVDRALTES